MSDEKPLAIDLYCGLGGWAEGFLAEGYRVIGFDIERHDYGTGGYPGQLVLQDVCTLHGSQFHDAAVIVASPPCQAYSYRAMPWSRAKALPPPDNTLFEQPFRIQREASEAASRYIPLIVENVRGAQKWVGKAAWHFGSYYLWGDVPALMPVVIAQRMKFKVDCSPLMWRDRVAETPEQAVMSGHLAKSQVKVSVQDWNNFRKTGELSPHWRMEGIKQSGISGPRNNGKGDRWFQDGAATFGSQSNQRRAAAAAIAKIPFPLAQHIARSYYPAPQMMVVRDPIGSIS